MGLLDVGSSVDKGEAIGNTPPGHVVPALGDGEGRIRAEAQIHILAGQIPKRAEVLRGALGRCDQAIRGIKSGAIRVEDDAGRVRRAADGDDVVDGSGRKFRKERSSLPYGFEARLVPPIPA
jgi:hypothetical protein